MKQQLILGLLFTGALGVTAGCGAGNVSLQSEAFATRTGLQGTGQGAAQETIMTGADVIDFKLCVKSVKFEGPIEDDGGNGSDDTGEIEFHPGLVDLTSGEAKEWGRLTLPEGFEATRIKVKVHKDRELCGTDYSIKFNDLTATADVEFRFRFNPPLTIKSGDKIQLTMGSVVTTLRQAAAAATLNLSNFKSLIENIEGHASLKM